MKAYLVVVVLLLAIFGAIGAYLYQRFSAFSNMDFSPPPVTIAVSSASLETWTETLNAVGSIKAVRGVELTSETSGEVTAIRFDSGDQVPIPTFPVDRKVKVLLGVFGWIRKDSLEPLVTSRMKKLVSLPTMSHR